MPMGSQKKCGVCLLHNCVWVFHKNTPTTVGILFTCKALVLYDQHKKCIVICGWCTQKPYNLGGEKCVLKNEYIRLLYTIYMTVRIKSMLGKWALFFFCCVKPTFQQCLEVFGSVTVYIFGWEVQQQK